MQCSVLSTCLLSVLSHYCIAFPKRLAGCWTNENLEFLHYTEYAQISPLVNTFHQQECEAHTLPANWKGADRTLGRGRSRLSTVPVTKKIMWGRLWGFLCDLCFRSLYPLGSHFYSGPFTCPSLGSRDLWVVFHDFKPPTVWFLPPWRFTYVRDSQWPKALRTSNLAVCAFWPALFPNLTHSVTLRSSLWCLGRKVFSPVRSSPHPSAPGELSPANPAAFGPRTEALGRTSPSPHHRNRPRTALGLNTFV